MAKKRAHGEGSIYKRKSDNRWTGKAQVGFNSDGSPKYKVVYGNSQKEVKDKLDKLKGSIRDNSFVEPSKVALVEWLDTWLNVTIKSFVKDTTFSIYESLIKNHIAVQLGAIKLSQLKAAHIQKFYNDKHTGGRLDGKEGGLSAKTIRHMHQILSSALTQAIAEKMIPSNVTEAVKPPRISFKEIPILNGEQVKKFIDVIKHHPHYKRYFAAYLTELYTGCRRGEILGLRHSDWSEKDCSIRLVQQLVVVKNKPVISDLKTDSSQNRVIMVPPELIDVLKTHREAEKLKFKQLGYNDIEIQQMASKGLVFTNELGKCIHPRNFSRAFKGALKVAQLPMVSWHSMRHAFATLSLQNGIDIKTLQSDLGHSQISTTLDRYGHISKEMKLEAARKRSQFLKESAGSY
jgi:integrase